jgi:chaperonin GroES
MNFKPLHDRVAVKPIASEEKTSGGIIIPDTAQEKPLQGEVVAVGTGSRNSNGDIIPLEVKVGDKVMYGKWGGTEVKINGQELMVMKESDIIGILA